MSYLPKPQVDHLKAFIASLRSKPDIIHDPALDFFREFLMAMEAKFPPKPDMPKEATMGPSPHHPHDHDDEVPIEEDDPESDLDLDMECVIAEPDSLDSHEMGDPGKMEMTDNESDKFKKARSAAMAAFSDSNWNKAIQLFTEAIKLNPQSAAMFAKRGTCFIKLQKPNACIRDCTRAIEINPNNVAAHKFRGRAHRLLGNFSEAAKDLWLACKIDFDNVADEWLKEVAPNAKKIEEHECKRQMKAEEKELLERIERIRFAFSGEPMSKNYFQVHETNYRMSDETAEERKTRLIKERQRRWMNRQSQEKLQKLLFQTKPKQSEIHAKVQTIEDGAQGVETANERRKQLHRESQERWKNKQKEESLQKAALQTVLQQYKSGAMLQTIEDGAQGVEAAKERKKFMNRERQRRWRNQQKKETLQKLPFQTKPQQSEIQDKVQTTEDRAQGVETAEERRKHLHRESQQRWKNKQKEASLQKAALQTVLQQCKSGAMVQTIEDEAQGVKAAEERKKIMNRECQRRWRNQQKKETLQKLPFQTKPKQSDIQAKVQTTQDVAQGVETAEERRKRLHRESQQRWKNKQKEESLQKAALQTVLQQCKSGAMVQTIEDGAQDVEAAEERKKFMNRERQQRWRNRKKLKNLLFLRTIHPKTIAREGKSLDKIFTNNIVIQELLKLSVTKSAVDSNL